MGTIIAIDVDDVLAHSTESLRQVVNASTGVNLTKEHYAVPGPYWSYYENVWKAHGIHERVPKEELHVQMVRDQSHIPPYPGAKKALIELAKRFQLVVITARSSEWEAATHSWLQANFPDVFSQVVFGGGRSDPANRTKAELCVEVGAQYLIDDNVEHCVGAAKAGVGALLFGTYGWQLDVPEGMVRCKSWQDVKKYFDEERSR